MVGVPPQQDLTGGTLTLAFNCNPPTGPRRRLGGEPAYSRAGTRVAHTDWVVLDQIEFRVQPAGWARLYGRSNTNVHAYAQDI